jgi:hypothetical protein
MFISITSFGNTPETRFTIPYMEIKEAHALLRKKLNVKSEKEIQHNISAIHSRNSSAIIPPEILKDYPLLNLS